MLFHQTCFHLVTSIKSLSNSDPLTVPAMLNTNWQRVLFFLTTKNAEALGDLVN